MEDAVKYNGFELEGHSDLIESPDYSLFYNNGENERHERGTLRVLSLFSGCGGMDIGLEGGFV
ncbi:MAG: hypothetical protein ACI3ZO_02820, partial [Candidatus Cryptobacteroides sp.]